tara:strand:- start:115 stop:771 length:657 start_codon:yes stop_codon:yes gene_type:complete
MMENLFKNSNLVSLPIQGTDDLFFVNHVYCVGRNYKAHAREMGADDRKPPFFFSKPKWAVAPTDSTIDFPKDTDNLNYEVELVIAVGEEKSIFGFGVGVDLTRRDIQRKAKEDGKPWFRGKCFEGSAPVSDIIPIGDRKEFDDLSLVLSVSGEMKQSGVCKDMIWNVGEIMCELAGDVPLQAGDLIFTGTPEGVGKLEKGDEVVVSIPGLVELSFHIL